jgi:hypothetical protein
MVIKRLLAVLVGVAIPLSLAHARAFSDVPDDYPYEKAIYDLQRRNIFTGDKNPDGTEKGTARPNDPLNRAELLALAYRAADKETRSVYAGCFPDTPIDAWFSDVVCTAKHNGDVQGNPNGKFLPEEHVNRVEAIKIILNTMGFSIPTLTQEDRLSLDFLSVTHSSWYAPYLHRALALDLIPTALTAGNEFDPSSPLLRGEAAEILYRALNTEDLLPEDQDVDDTEDTEDTTDDDTVDETDDTTDDQTDDATDTTDDQTDVGETPTGATLVTFPIHRTGQTGERGATAYAFDLSEPGTVLVESTNLTSASTGISCYLYLLGDSGFSSEFFVGYQENGSCYIRAALRAGRYQVEVRSVSEGAEYSLDATPSTGDGNDGFTEAIALRVGSPRTSSLIANDYEDWYRFRVGSNETHRVKLSSSDSLPCSIYPSEDVDLFGFQGPQCGDSYDYPPGTYYISIKKTPPAAGSQSYTIELR